MNIAVIGTGGVGGYFGGLLTQLMPQLEHLKIYFIARGSHLEEIRHNGLLLDTDKGQFVCKPTMATDDISGLPELDLCLLCVKSYDLEAALRNLKGKIGNTTMILPLLNGVDIYDRIRAVVKNGIVFPSCVYVGTHIEKPGKVTQRGGTANIIFGRDPANMMVPNMLFNLFGKAGIKYNWTDDPYPEIWSKFTFIAAFGLVTADSGKTIGQVLESPELSGQVTGIMKEIIAIASKSGISLPETLVEDSFKKARAFPPETKTSFQRDYEVAGRPDERDLFGGTIIRLGKKTGIAVEATQKVYDSISGKKSCPVSLQRHPSWVSLRE